MLNTKELEKRWFRYKLKSYLPLITMTLFIIAIIVSIFIAVSSEKKEKRIVSHKTVIKQKKAQIPKQIAVKKTAPIKEQHTTILSPSMDFIKQMKAIKTKEKRAPSTTVSIIKQDTNKDIQNILQRFQKEKNPTLSLFLARKYYALGNYKDASKYALITNQLNNEIEESWLIFSKTLVKMHHKNKAMHILKRYIQTTHSTDAAILLHKIQSGKFQ